MDHRQSIVALTAETARPRRPYRWQSTLVRHRWLGVALLFLVGQMMSQTASAAITYKQSNWNTQIPPQDMIRVYFPGAQTAGNLNVVIVGWADPNVSITSVTDLKGNAYTLAVGPTTSAGNAKQSIYYAKNIVAAAAGTNAVTVMFSTGALYPDVRVAEYSGINTTSPFDGAIGAAGSGTSLNSGSITTTNANDLLVTGNYVQQDTASIGSGFTSRVGTDMQHFLADKVVSSVGSYNATSTQTGCCYWIQQIAAFKKASTGTIAYVQGAYVSQLSPPPQNTLSASFPVAQTAGSLNVVVVGWKSNTVTVTSVTDTKGNQYSLAVGPTISPQWGSQSIYYAKNIAAAQAEENIVTVTFSATIPYIDLRVAEYGGIDLVNPLDGASGANGEGTLMDSGAVTTTNANDLLVTGNFIEQVTVDVGSGFTLRDQTDFEDMYADRIVSSVGTYHATAEQDACCYWVMQMAAFKAAAGGADTQAPSVPSGLTTTLINSTQINLSWTASTDNVGVTGYEVQRCQGASCTNWASVGTPSSNAFNNTGLSPSTTYRFQVRARDAVPNWSGYSTILNVTTSATPDTTAPSVPTGLTTTLVNSTQINLSWTASTDNVGVTGYEVQRCQGASCTNWASVGTPSSNSFNNTSLSPSTTYRFQVRARDAVPNWSAYSTIFNVTTSATPDTTAPSIPTGLTTTLVNSTQINLSWTASTDNVGVTGYEVQRCQGASCTNWASVGTPSSNSFNNTGLSPSTTYRFQVRARDAVPNWSAYSTILNVTTSAAPDTQAPTVPSGLTTTLVNSTQINLSWTASTDNVAVTGYEVQRCQGASCTNWASIGTPTSPSLNDTGLSPSTTYRYQVRARDAVPNWSAYSTILNVTTSAPPDTTAPSVPSGLTTTLVNSTQINLSWTASTDNVGVTGYEVQRCQGASCTTWASVGTPSSNSFNNTGLSPSTTYRFQVRARDAVPNWSAYSTIFNVTTSAPPDTTAPSVPAGLTTTLVNGTQINLSWTASTDNVGVTGYEVQRCQGASCTSWASVGTPSSNSFSNTGLSPSTTYRFQVRARDAVPNWSGYSTILTVMTQSAAAPPTGVNVTASSDKEIDLAWTASVTPGVTGYVIERCQGAGCSNFAQIGSVVNTAFVYDAGLTASTTYRYQLRSVDGAGAQGAPSAVLTVLTLAANACN